MKNYDAYDTWKSDTIEYVEDFCQRDENGEENEHEHENNDDDDYDPENDARHYHETRDSRQCKTQRQLRKEHYELKENASRNLKEFDYIKLRFHYLRQLFFLSPDYNCPWFIQFIVQFFNMPTVPEDAPIWIFTLPEILESLTSCFVKHILYRHIYNTAKNKFLSKFNIFRSCLFRHVLSAFIFPDYVRIVDRSRRFDYDFDKILVFKKFDYSLGYFCSTMGKQEPSGLIKGVYERRWRMVNGQQKFEIYVSTAYLISYKDNNLPPYFKRYNKYVFYPQLSDDDVSYLCLNLFQYKEEEQED